MLQFTDFVWTWNIFLTFALGIGGTVAAWLVTNSFKRQFEKRDRKEERIAELLAAVVNGKAKSLAEKEEIKSEHVEEWRQELKRIQDCTLKRLDEIAARLEAKVDWSYCNERRKEVDEQLRHK